jgi:cell division protein FtsL
MMYKFLSIFLAVLLLVAGGAIAYQRWDHSKQRRELNNKLAKVQKMQQETETAYSRLALEYEGLESSNKELQEIIEDRDEAILALTTANVKLKDRVFKFENAKQTIVDDVDVSVECDGLKSALRLRVDFEKEEDPLQVVGYTVTNPAYAEVQINWLRALKLELVLTQNPDKTYRVYINSENSDVVPTDLVLQVDPSVLDYKWYQKIGFGSNVVFGETGIQIGISAFYDFLPNFYAGPLFQVGYINGKAETYYGVKVGWYPWK